MENLTVSKPVSSGSQRSLLGTSTERESLANDDPGHGTPSTSERGDEHARRHDHDNTNSLVGVGIDGSSDGGENEEPGRLPERTDEQRPAATELLNNVETVESHDNVDSAKNELHQDRVVDAGRREDSSAVVEEVVDTSPLLEEVNEDTEESTVDELGNAGLGVEALDPATSTNLTLLLENLPHLVEIVLDKGVLGIILQATEAAQSHARILPATLLSEPSRAFGNDHDTTAKGQGEQDTKTDDNAP